MSLRAETKTGGRDATRRHIFGRFALSVGMPGVPSAQGWRWVALSDVARMESGHTPSRQHPEYWGGDVPWIGIRDGKAHHGETIYETIQTTNELGIQNSSARILPEGTVCLSRTASVGYVVTMGRPMATSQDFANWICSDQIDCRFLVYLFLAEHDSLLRFASGAIHQTIYYPELKALHVCLPPLPEQQRIVAILDEAFAGLATATSNAEKNLKNARELFEGYLNSIFENGKRQRKVTFGEVCSISSKLVDPREPKFLDLPHLGAGNMASRTGELSDIKTAREEGLKSGKFLFDSTMVLYSKIRPYLMKACRPNFEGLCSADVYPLSSSPAQLDRNFLFHLLMSKNFTDFAIAGSDRAGMPKVNRDHLFKYPFGLPSIEEQALLAGKLDEISNETNRLAGFYEQRLIDIASLKQSTLQRAFSGELTSPPSRALREAAE